MSDITPLSCKPSTECQRFQGWFGFPVWAVGRWFAAGLLVLAALGKSIQLTTVPLIENPIWNDRFFNLALISLEIVLGFWLVSGYFAKWARRVTLAVFCTFLVASLMIWASGSSSCGCFGSVQVPIGFTLVLDALVVCLLVMDAKRQYPTTPRPGMVLLGGVGLLSVILLIVFNRPMTLIDSSSLALANGPVIVEPERWEGKELPIAQSIDGELAPVLQGRWTVVLFHEDCPDCRRLIQETIKSGATCAFIEVPPVAPIRRQNQQNQKWLSLKDQTDWFVAAPASFTLEDGVVVAPFN